MKGGKLMVIDRLRKAIRRNPDPLKNECTLEHCRNCQGECPLIDGCC